MSKEQKTGEDLIEKVEQETTGEAVENKEEKEDFNPKAFSSNGAEKKEDSESEEDVSEEKSEDDEEDDDDFDWNSVEDDDEDEEDKKEDEDWDDEPEAKKEEKGEDVKEAVYDWGTLAQELGVEAKDEESFKKAIVAAINEPAPVNDTIQNLQGFLNMKDVELVKADLEASGMEKGEIKDTVDRLNDSGLLKREAVMIRKNLQDYIRNERDRLVKIEKQEREEGEKRALSTKKSLQKYIKTKEDFFGGKVGCKEKKELYNYITSGGFAEDIYASTANVADAAFLWKYKDKIFKMLTGQGVEKGKASVLNKITNPSKGRRSQQVKAKQKGGFDASEFMK